MSGIHLHPAKEVSREHLFEAFLGEVAGNKITDEIASKLGKLSRPIRIDRGGTLPINPAKGAVIYVGNGATKLIAHTPCGRGQIIAFHFPGDLVSIPVGAKYSCSLGGLVDTDVLSFRADEFFQMVGSQPVFLNALLHRSLVALDRCRGKVVVLGRKNAQERLASFLIGMADRIGSTEAGECLLDLPMSHRDIGDSLGLTIETISRQFGELRKAGLVKTTGRSRVFLCNLPALTKRAVNF